MALLDVDLIPRRTIPRRARAEASQTFRRVTYGLHHTKHTPPAQSGQQSRRRSIFAAYTRTLERRVQAKAIQEAPICRAEPTQGSYSAATEPLQTPARSGLCRTPDTQEVGLRFHVRSSYTFSREQRCRPTVLVNEPAQLRFSMALSRHRRVRCGSWFGRNVMAQPL